MTLRAAGPEEAGFRAGRPGRRRPRGRGGGGRAGVPGRACWPWARTARSSHLRPFGRLSYDAGAPAVRTDTIYDLASLTKVIVTTTMAMILVDEGKLDLAKPVSAFLPRVPRRGQGQGHGRAPADPLLGHRLVGAALQGDQGQGGVPRAHRGHGPGLRAGDEVASTATSASSCWARSWSAWPGRTSSPSRATRIFGPLGMKDTTLPARPGAAAAHRAHREGPVARPRRCAARCTTRTRSRSGGVAPHAGLFGTAPDLARFAQMLLERRRARAPAHRLARDVEQVHAAGRACPARAGPSGWDTPERELVGGEPVRPALLRPHRASPGPRCGSIPSASCSSSC